MTAGLKKRLIVSFNNYHFEFMGTDSLVTCFRIFVKRYTTPQTSRLSSSKYSLAKLQVGHAKSHLWSVK